MELRFPLKTRGSECDVRATHPVLCNLWEVPKCLRALISSDVEWKEKLGQCHKFMVNIKVVPHAKHYISIRKMGTQDTIFLTEARRSKALRRRFYLECDLQEHFPNLSSSYGVWWSEEWVTTFCWFGKVLSLSHLFILLLNKKEGFQILTCIWESPNPEY